MATSLRVDPTSSVGTSTSPADTIDNGVQSGDLIVQICMKGTGITTGGDFTVPSGWTLIDKAEHDNVAAVAAAYLVSAGTEGGTAPAWTINNDEWQVVTFIVQNPNATPIAATTQAVDSLGPSTTHSITGWTTDTGNGGLLFATLVSHEQATAVEEGPNNEWEAVQRKFLPNVFSGGAGGSSGVDGAISWANAPGNFLLPDFDYVLDQSQEACFLAFMVVSDTNLDSTPPIRVTDAFVEVLDDDTPAVRVTDAFVEVLHDDIPAVRVTDAFVEVIHSTREAFIFNGSTVVYVGDDQAGGQL